MTHKKLINILGIFVFIVFVLAIAYEVTLKSEIVNFAKLKKTAKKTLTPSPSPLIVPGEPKVEKSSSLSLSSNVLIYNKGEVINVSVLANASDKKVDGVEFVIKYDPNALSAEKINDGNFFGLYPQKKIDSEAGTIKVIALVKPDEKKVLNNAQVVTLTLKALKAGDATLSFVQDKSHIAGYGGQELLKDVKPLTISVK